MRNAADIRQANAYDVVRSLHAAGIASRKQLSERIGLSFQTVATICTGLIDLGLVTEVAREKAGAGRPTTHLALDPRHGRMLGVDLAETYVQVETFNTALEPISKTELELDQHRRSPHQIVARLREAIELEAAHAPELPLRGIGISVPGQVDREGGASVFAPNWDWHNVPLREMVTGVVDAPLHLDNPLKARVIAELWLRPERVTQDFAMVNLGTGVGLGAALEGRILRGRTNSAGEWGHTVIVAGGRACRCGSRGCVETYVGAAGILQTLRETAPESPLLRADDQAATVRALHEAYGEGDATAIAVVEQTAYYLGIALATVVNMLNPEAIILGSWVADELGDELLERARPHLAAHALAVPLLATTLAVDGGRTNAVTLGAAASALEGYLRSASAVETTTALPPRSLPVAGVSA